MRVETIRSIAGDRAITAPTLQRSGDMAHPSFLEELKSTVKGVNDRQLQADQAMATGATEGPNKIHETMIQLEETDLSTRLLLKVRTKALDAYQEIMRMQF
jgi:flagellar hook-basal body complex protein FliE